MIKLLLCPFVLRIDYRKIMELCVMERTMKYLKCLRIQSKWYPWERKNLLLVLRALRIEAPRFTIVLGKRKINPKVTAWISRFKILKQQCITWRFRFVSKILKFCKFFCRILSKGWNSNWENTFWDVECAEWIFFKSI